MHWSVKCPDQRGYTVCKHTTTDIQTDKQIYLKARIYLNVYTYRMKDKQVRRYVRYSFSRTIYTHARTEARTYSGTHTRYKCVSRSPNCHQMAPSASSDVLFLGKQHNYDNTEYNEYNSQNTHCIRHHLVSVSLPRIVETKSTSSD